MKKIILFLAHLSFSEEIVSRLSNKYAHEQAHLSFIPALPKILQGMQN